MKRLNRRIILSALLALLLAAAALSAGCGRSSLVAGDNTVPGAQYGAVTDNPASSGISVSAQGSVTVKPTVAYVQFGVETMNVEAGKARKANDEAMAKVMEAIKGFGISEDDVTTTNYSIYPRYDEKGENPIGYTVSNNVQVKVMKLEQLGDLLTAASEAGANIEGGISFDVQDRTAAYNEALAQAMDKAKARADVMAKACGVTLGKAITISESSSYSGPTFAVAEDALAAKAAGAVPVSGGTLDVTASVSVVYEIVK